MKKINTVASYIVIIFMALIGAFVYEIFIFPNSFAPAGINGICTMIQYLTGINIGYLSLIINIPLALLVYFKVSRSMAVRSMVYVLVFSLSLLLLDYVDLSYFAYETANGTSTILGPLVAGIIMGFCYYVLIKAGSYTGGMDYISSLINKKHPEKSMFKIIFFLNASVAIVSYFVYNCQLEPVILCILYCFASMTVGDLFRKNDRSAVRFEIITAYPEEISNEIITKLKHSATKISASGMYSGTEKYVITCVVNRSQIVKMTDILKKYPQTFAMMSTVHEIVGNFKDISDLGNVIEPFLDDGDTNS